MLNTVLLEEGRRFFEFRTIRDTKAQVIQSYAVWAEAIVFNCLAGIPRWSYPQKHVAVGEYKPWRQFRGHRKVEQAGVKVTGTDRVGDDQPNVMDAGVVIFVDMPCPFLLWLLDLFNTLQ